jgi:hypothetical protein
MTNQTQSGRSVPASLSFIPARRDVLILAPGSRLLAPSKNETNPISRIFNPKTRITKKRTQFTTKSKPNSDISTMDPKNKTNPNMPFFNRKSNLENLSPRDRKSQNEPKLILDLTGRILYRLFDTIYPLFPFILTSPTGCGTKSYLQSGPRNGLCGCSLFQDRACKQAKAFVKLQFTRPALKVQVLPAASAD